MLIIDRIGNAKFKVSNLKYWVFIGVCFFPFIDFFKLETDTQPNALLLAFIILTFSFKERFPKYFMLYFLVLIFSLTLLPFAKIDFNIVKGVINYLSVAVVPLAVFISLKKLNGLSYLFFRNIVVLWGVVGLIQRLIDTSFLTSLLSRSTGSGIHGRGVGSLAPEPTYYGSIIVLFLIVYIINFYEKKDRKLLFFMLIQLLALSVSSTVLAVIAVSTGIFILCSFFRLRLKTIAISVVTVVVFTITALTTKSHWENTRIYAIGNMVMNNPKLILLDESISERVNHAFFPLVSLVDQVGIPHGYGNFEKYINEKANSADYKTFFVLYNKEHYVKIMSSYGMVFFELGIFGLLIPICIYLSFRKFLLFDRFLFAFILLNLLLFTAMSFNNSLVLFVLGNILYLRAVLIKKQIEDVESSVV